MGMSEATTWVLELLTHLLSPCDPPSRGVAFRVLGLGGRPSSL